MSWTLLPGVRQDKHGFYQVAVNSRGKQDRIPYEANGAPAARTIPPPPEWKPSYKPRIMREMGTGRPIIHIPKRVHYTAVIWQGNKHASLGVSLPDEFLLPLSISPDCGKTWQPLELPPVVWQRQCHVDEGDDIPTDLKHKGLA